MIFIGLNSLNHGRNCISDNTIMKSEITLWLHNKFIQRYADTSVILYVSFWRLCGIFADEILAVGVKHNKKPRSVYSV